MKSGMYITEVVKRLYQPEKMKALYPNSSKRLEHIMEHQVYGAAPTEIIYMIAMHYIFGYKGDIGNWSAEDLQTLYPNFVLEDTAELAKQGKLAEWATSKFNDAFDDEAINEIKNQTNATENPGLGESGKKVTRKAKKGSSMAVGTEVTHSKYGTGEVISMTGGKIEIRFDNDGVVRKFPYPDEITEGFIKT